MNKSYIIFFFLLKQSKIVQLFFIVYKINIFQENCVNKNK